MPLNFCEFLNARDKRLTRVFLEKHKQVKEFMFGGKNLEIPSTDIFLEDLLRYREEDFIGFGGYEEVVKTGYGRKRRLY